MVVNSNFNFPISYSNLNRIETSKTTVQNKKEREVKAKIIYKYIIGIQSTQGKELKGDTQEYEM